MQAEHWEKVAELYHSARERQPDQRSAFLAGACQGDEELRREVESLLQQDVSKDGVLERVDRKALFSMVGQTLNPATKQPVGAPQPIYHLHTARRSSLAFPSFRSSLAPDKPVFPLRQLTAIAGWRKAKAAVKGYCTAILTSGPAIQAAVN